MRTPLRSLWAPAALLLTLAGLVGAQEVFHHEAGGIEFELQAGWTYETEGDVMTFGPGDHKGFETTLWVHVSDDWADLDVALDALDEELDHHLDDIHFDAKKAEKVEINGMKGLFETGTATHDGHPIEWEVGVVLAKEPVICITFSDPESFDDQDVAELKKFVRSFKPTKH